jgi:hypothetical protein
VTNTHGFELFKRTFRPREIENVCVLVFAEDFDPDADALLLSAGVESMVRAGIAGFVFDLTQFSRHADLEQGLGHLVRCMRPVLANGAVLNWLRGSRFVQEWKHLRLLGMPPDNFETEREAVEEIQTASQAARVRGDLSQRMVNSGVSFLDIANASGLFESDVRRIAEGLETPSDRVVVQISSTLDSLRMQKSSPNKAAGVPAPSPSPRDG